MWNLRSLEGWDALQSVLIFQKNLERHKIYIFAVICLVVKPLNWSEAEGDLGMIQTVL